MDTLLGRLVLIPFFAAALAAFIVALLAEWSGDMARRITSEKAP